MYVYAYMLDFFSLFNNIHFFLVPHISLPEPNQSNSNLKHTRVFIHWIQNFRGHSFWTECNFPFFSFLFHTKEPKILYVYEYDVLPRQLPGIGIAWHEYHFLAFYSNMDTFIMFLGNHFGNIQFFSFFHFYYKRFFSSS